MISEARSRKAAVDKRAGRGVLGRWVARNDESHASEGWSDFLASDEDSCVRRHVEEGGPGKLEGVDMLLYK